MKKSILSKAGLREVRSRNTTKAWRDTFEKGRVAGRTEAVACIMELMSLMNEAVGMGTNGMRKVNAELRAVLTRLQEQ